MPQSRHGPAREQWLADTFVALADTLTADFDLVEVHRRLVDTCVDVLGAAGAGLMLADTDGRLAVVAASVEVAAVESFELQSDEGPCLECFRTGAAVPDTDLAASRDRWPRLVPVALEAGFTRVRALPLHLRGRVIGALNLFGSVDTAIAADDVRIAQALADVATIALLQQRAVADGELVTRQLQTALATRVVVEQAKGMLAEGGGTGVDQAFELLRSSARSRRVAVADLARELVEGRRPVDDVLRGRPAPPSSGGSTDPTR